MFFYRMHGPISCLIAVLQGFKIMYMSWVYVVNVCTWIYERVAFRQCYSVQRPGLLALRECVPLTLNWINHSVM